ncbi:hypothetical protein L9F63_009665, partial [Diploptera punctata]
LDPGKCTDSTSHYPKHFTIRDNNNTCVTYDTDATFTIVEIHSSNIHFVRKSIHAIIILYSRCRTLKTSIMFSVYAEKRNLIRVYQRIQLEEQENRRNIARRR